MKANGIIINVTIQTLMYMYYIKLYCVDEGVSVKETEIPGHLEAMVELLCKEDTQKGTRDPGTMVGLSQPPSLLATIIFHLQ